MSDYMDTFSSVLADSGAYSAFNSGKQIDLMAYCQWIEDRRGRLVAAAALDSIEGDWKQSLRNWDEAAHTFPVLHDSDPPEYIDAVLERMQDNNRARLREGGRQWLGVGLVPPRKNTEWVLSVLRKIPVGVHVHLFAMRGLIGRAIQIRHDLSCDSINWILDAFAIAKKLPWLTTAECLDLVVKRYQREPFRAGKTESKQEEMF
jgi:hypothetical protein